MADCITCRLRKTKCGTWQFSEPMSMFTIDFVFTWAIIADSMIFNALLPLSNGACRIRMLPLITLGHGLVSTAGLLIYKHRPATIAFRATRALTSWTTACREHNRSAFRGSPNAAVCYSECKTAIISPAKHILDTITPRIQSPPATPRYSGMSKYLVVLLLHRSRRPPDSIYTLSETWGPFYIRCKIDNQIASCHSQMFGRETKVCERKDV